MGERAWDRSEPPMNQSAAIPRYRQNQVASWQTFGGNGNDSLLEIEWNKMDRRRAVLLAFGVDCFPI